MALNVSLSTPVSVPVMVVFVFDWQAPNKTAPAAKAHAMFFFICDVV